MRALSRADGVSVVAIEHAADGRAQPFLRLLSSQSLPPAETLRVPSPPGRDLAAALGAALLHARSEWVLFVGTDDRLTLQALEWLASAATLEGADVAHGGWTSPEGGPAAARFGPGERDLFPHTARALPFPLPVCLFRRSAVIAAGGFDDHERPLLAWDLLQRLARGGAQFAAVDRLVAHLGHDGREECADVRTETARGIDIIRRGHGRDSRVREPVLAHREGASADGLADALYAYVAGQAATDLGQGRDARPLLDLVDGALPHDVDGPGLALRIFEAVATARQVDPAAWPGAWSEVGPMAAAFLDALEKRTALSGLRLEVERELERCVMRGVSAGKGLSFGRMVREPLGIGQTVQDVRVGRGKECLQAVVAAGRDILVTAELPALREVVAAEEVAAAINDGGPGLVRAAARMPVKAGDGPEPFGRRHFEETFASPDPWGAESDYERAKLAHTLSLLPSACLGRVLEVGCGEGAFSQAVAPLTESLLGIDISTRALSRASARCAAFGHVRFAAMDLRHGLPRGRFRLVVCNETLGYLADGAALRSAVRALADRLEEGGFLLTANARLSSEERGECGFDWNLPFGAGSIVSEFKAVPGLHLVRELRTPLYRVALFERSAAERSETPVVEEQPLPAWPEHPHGQAVRGQPDREEGGARRPPPPEIPVLLYHRVASDGPAHLAPYRVSPEHFDHQLECLRREGHEPLSIETWRAARRGLARLPPRPVLITFDDGSLDFATDAWPRLKAHGFPAMVFLVADAVGGGAEEDPWWRAGAPLLGWEDVLRLQEDGVRFGSHGARHRKLTRLSLPEACGEGVRSRALLERRLGRPVRELAYPRGAQDPMIARAMAACGYNAAFTSTAEGTGGRRNPMRLPRLPVGDHDGETLLARLGEWAKGAGATVPFGATGKLRLVIHAGGLPSAALEPGVMPFLCSLRERNGGDGAPHPPGDEPMPDDRRALWVEAAPAEAASQFAHNVTPETAFASVSLNDGVDPARVDDAISTIFSRANALFPEVEAIVDGGSPGGARISLARTAGRPQARLALSVVVPTYNRRARLERLWDGLRAQTLPPDSFEVVVVDDGSTDGTPAWLGEQARAGFPHLRGLSQPHAGPAAARNRGLREAGGSLVLFLDDDLVPERECLAAHVAFHARWPGLAHAGLGHIHPPAVEDAPLASVLGAAGSPVLDWSYVRSRDPHDLGWRCFWSCHLSVKRDFLLAHGRFDDRTFASAMGEDVELALRLQRAGLVLHFVAEADAHSTDTLDLRACVERERKKGSVGRDLAASGLGDEWARTTLEKRRLYSQRALDEVVGAVEEFLAEPAPDEDRRVVVSAAMRFANLVGGAEREGDSREGVGAVVALLHALAVTEASVGQRWHEKDRQIAEAEQVWRAKDAEIAARDAHIAYLSARWRRVRSLVAPALWARQLWRQRRGR